MDEYLFITLAKLKADRRKLEREQLEEARRQATEQHADTDERAAPSAREFVPLLAWR